MPRIILTHGTFSDGRSCRHLGAWLEAQGHPTSIHEWSGHGRDAGPLEGDYEARADREAGRLLRRSREPLVWIGHSAGGLLPWLYLARHPEESARFAGIVSIASQTTHAAASLPKRLQLLAALAAASLSGRAPSWLFRSGPVDESAAMIRQWARWNLDGRCTGRDGFDYFPALSRVAVPALFIASGRDDVAPIAGCRALFDAVGGPDKTFVERSHSHAGLVTRSAERDVFPVIGAWLAERLAHS